MKCKICGSEYVKNEFDCFYSCLSCGVWFQYPQPSKKDVLNNYNSGKFSQVGYYFSTMFEDLKSFQIRIDFIKKTLGPIRTGFFDVLDVGCNVGTMITVCENNGFDIMGSDINENAVKMCRRLGHKAFVGSFPKNKLFDLIIMSDVLEHVTDPKAFMLEAKNNLFDNGLLLITTPDVDSFARKILGRRWNHFKRDEHLFYFNRSSLVFLAETCGFAIIAYEHLTRYRRFKIILDRAKKINKLLYWMLYLWPFKNMLIPLNTKDEMTVLLRRRQL